MNIKITMSNCEYSRRFIEIDGKRVGTLTAPENYRVIHSISTQGTIQFIMIPDTIALQTAGRITAQLTTNLEGEETV